MTFSEWLEKQHKTALPNLRGDTIQTLLQEGPDPFNRGSKEFDFVDANGTVAAEIRRLNAEYKLATKHPRLYIHLQFACVNGWGELVATRFAHSTRLVYLGSRPNADGVFSILIKHMIGAGNKILPVKFASNNYRHYDPADNHDHAGGAFCGEWDTRRGWNWMDAYCCSTEFLLTFEQALHLARKERKSLGDGTARRTFRKRMIEHGGEGIVDRILGPDFV